jgi:hypothetical protein
MKPYGMPDGLRWHKTRVAGGSKMLGSKLIGEHRCGAPAGGP